MILDAFPNFLMIQFECANVLHLPAMGWDQRKKSFIAIVV